MVDLTEGVGSELVLPVFIRRAVGSQGKQIFRAYIKAGDKYWPMFMGAYSPSRVIDGVQTMWPSRQFQFVVEGMENA